MFPFKQRDTDIVESFSDFQISRKELSARNEASIQENKQDLTILQSLNDAQKQQNSQQNSTVKIQRDKSQTHIIKTQNRLSKPQLKQSYQMCNLNATTNIDDLIIKQAQPVRLMKVLKLLVNIQHFFRILSMNSRIFNKLTQQQHYLISDVSSNYQKNGKSKKSGNKTFNLFKSSQYLLIELIQKLNSNVFTPSSNIIYTWDTLQSILIIYSTFLLNLELFFDMDISEYYLFFQIIFFIFIVDIFVELNTGVLKKGNIIKDRNVIFKAYLKDRLLKNLVGNIPLFFYFSKVEVSIFIRAFINVLLAFKWIKIQNVLKKITFYVSYEKDHKNMFDLFQLLVFVIGICHFFCLFWHGLAMLEAKNGVETNWLASKNLLNASIQERYIYSFYYLAVTMATVGYGDIIPQNKYEVVFITITIFVTCIVYAFSLNTIGSIIESIEKKDKKYKENLQVIHGLMREEEVSRNLKIKISDYIEYLYKESNEIQRKQQKLIIEKLSAKLRNDLTLEIQGKYLSNIPLFKSIQEKDKIAKIMEEQLYSPSEIIFTQGDIDDGSLYYIVKGSVSIIYDPDQFSNRDCIQIDIKEKKQYFGEISFITGNPRTFTAKAADFCKIYKINREQFLSVIKENDHDFENFQMTKEALTLNKNFKFCSIFCSTCKSGKHFSIDCPRTHLTFTRQIIISRHNSYAPQERALFERGEKKKNYAQKKMQLQQAILEIHNIDSLSEIVDLMENGSEYQKDQSENENAKQDKQEVQFDIEKQQNRRDSTLPPSKIDNLGSQIEIVRKQEKSAENQQDKNLDLNRRKSRRDYSLMQQNSLSPNNDQMNQKQKFQRKSFLYSVNQNQQLLQEMQKLEQFDKKQSSINNILQQSSSQSSITSLSSKEDTKKNDSDKSIKIKKEVNFNVKKSFLISNFQDEKQNQFLEDISYQQRPSQISQRRYSNILKQKNNSLRNIPSNNEGNEQFLLNDQLNSKNFVQQKVNNQGLNERILSINSNQNSKEFNQLDTYLQIIQNNSSRMIEGQISKLSNLQVNFEPLTLKQYQSLSSNYSIMQPQMLSSNSQTKLSQPQSQYSTTQLSKQNTVGILSKNDKKFQDSNESQDQSNYFMLQTFDRAKIFKHYWPNFNILEIVQQWISYQSNIQKDFLNKTKVKRQKLLKKQSQNYLSFKTFK